MERLRLDLGPGDEVDAPGILRVQVEVSEIPPGTNFLTGQLQFEARRPLKVPDLLRQMNGCVKEVGPQSLAGAEILWKRTADPRLNDTEVCEECSCAQSGRSGCIIYECARS